MSLGHMGRNSLRMISEIMKIHLKSLHEFRLTPIPFRPKEKCEGYLVTWEEMDTSD